jgi:hypothetical protein
MILFYHLKLSKVSSRNRNKFIIKLNLNILHIFHKLGSIILKSAIIAKKCIKYSRILISMLRIADTFFQRKLVCAYFDNSICFALSASIFIKIIFLSQSHLIPLTFLARFVTFSTILNLKIVPKSFSANT